MKPESVLIFVLRFFSPFGTFAAIATTAIVAVLVASGLPPLVALSMWCLAIAYNIRNF